MPTTMPLSGRIIRNAAATQTKMVMAIVVHMEKKFQVISTIIAPTTTWPTTKMLR